MNQAQENIKRRKIFITVKTALELKTLWECAATGHPPGDDEVSEGTKKLWERIMDDELKWEQIEVKEETK